MKTIIAGGREYKFTQEDSSFLDAIKHKITEVICGCARGADQAGKRWAELNKIPVKEFPAEWNIHGRSAGIKRNYEMAKYADALVIFPGGKGSANMFLTAAELGLDIYDPREFYPKQEQFLNLIEKYDE